MRINDFFVPEQSELSMPYIIAEAGVNHEGDMDKAKRLIDEACEGGAHAIKFQTYKAETLASKNSPAYWDTTKETTKSQYELFKKHDSFWKKECEEMKRHCDKVGITFLSTPFDVDSAHFLNDLMDVFKISSSDITNKPFIRILCSFGKPIILSTGASSLAEIAQAVDWIEKEGNPLALLHCVLNYPTEDANAALGMIVALRQHFPNHTIGYSDHTLPGSMQILETAALLGARILEKHFTFDKTLPGNDHYHAMDKEDLKAFKKRMTDILTSIGPYTVRSLPEEETARRNARRSLVTKRAVKKGELLKADDLTWKRPAYGIAPSFYDTVIGMRVRHDLDCDHILTWSDLEETGH
ncbi:MAG: N-acetylneuraminate synthase family protein [Desulfovibrionaceae bacterium]|nr:N-acetylneuraminate synthase family protein [Desulfovibrionaceae bacterium]